MGKPKIVNFYIGGFNVPFRVYDDPNIVRNMKQYCGIWEPMHSLMVMMLCAEVVVLNPNPIFIDIGSYCGYFATMVAHFFPTIEVHAIEPHPWNYELLQYNTKKYSNVYTHNCAIGEKSSISELCFCAESTSGASLDRSAILRENVEVVDVQVKQLKDCGIDFNRVFFVKVDTQGCETKILDSIKNYLTPKCRISAEDDLTMREYLKDNKSYRSLAEVNGNIFIMEKK